MVRSEGNVSLKNPATPPGIDPATFRLVAQRLNHYATPGPLIIVSSTYFEHPIVHPPEDLYMYMYLPSIRLLKWMHERNTIKLHVFFKKNSWMFEICLRHYY